MLNILCSLSETMDVDTGVAERPAYWARTLLVTGLVPVTRTGSWGFRLPLGRRVMLGRCPVLSGRSASGFLTLDTSPSASGQVRDPGKFRDCQTVLNARNLASDLWIRMLALSLG